MRRVHGTAGLAILLLGASLIACQPAPPKPKTPDQLACADPAAPSRVNFRLAVEHDQPRPVPGADMYENPDVPGASPLAVRREVVISGRNIEQAVPGFDAAGGPVINVFFNAQGAAQIARATLAPREGARLALIMDDELIAAPHFGGPISGPSLQMSTGLSAQATGVLAKAMDLAAKGCAPVPSKPAPSPP